MPTLDLGKRRAETNQESLDVTLDGHTWTLPGSISMATFRSMAKMGSTQDPVQIAGILDGVVHDLFGDKAEEAAALLGPSDIYAIIEHYGTTMGESSASSAP